MIRRILCTECGVEHPLPFEDKQVGWKQRHRKLKVKKPKEHSIEITTDSSHEHIDLPHILCDYCSKPLLDGTTAIAWTMWRGLEAPNWEQEFGEVQSN